MTIYYWIVAQHSGKALEIEGTKIVQYPKKSEGDPNVKLFCTKILIK